MWLDHLLSEGVQGFIQTGVLSFREELLVLYALVALGSIGATLIALPPPCPPDLTQFFVFRHIGLFHTWRTLMQTGPTHKVYTSWEVDQIRIKATLYLKVIASTVSLGATSTPFHLHGTPNPSIRHSQRHFSNLPHFRMLRLPGADITGSAPPLSLPNTHLALTSSPHLTTPRRGRTRRETQVIYVLVVVMGVGH